MQTTSSQKTPTDEDRFVGLCIARLGHTIATIAEEKTRLESEVIRLTTRVQYRALALLSKKRRKVVGRRQMQLVQAKTRLAQVKQIESSLRKSDTRSYRDEYRRICVIPRVVNVEVVGTTLVITTDTLYGKHPEDNTWHLIGEFYIVVDVCEADPKKVRWHPLHDNVYHNMYSPTGIEKDGSRTCLGTAFTPLREALQKGSYEDLVALLVRFPECPGGEIRIGNWPKVDPKYVPGWYTETFGAD